MISLGLSNASGRLSCFATAAGLHESILQHSWIAALFALFATLSELSGEA
jgi:hypothetical protein